LIFSKNSLNSSVSQQVLLYENYTNSKYHKKVIEYNKKKGAIHPRNPWCLYMNGEPLPEFITQWDSDCSIEMCCPLNEECDRCI